MTFNKIRDFIFENYYRQTGFSKENSYYQMTHQKNVPEPSNAKEYYNFYLKKKKLKLVITQ